MPPSLGECVEYSPLGFCVEWDVPTPGGPGQSGGGGQGSDEVQCYWVTIPEDLSDDPTIWVDFGLTPPPDGVTVVWQEWECCGRVDAVRLSVGDPGDTGEPGDDRGWRARLGGCHSLRWGRAPPMGTASIVGVPVFVEVTNWTDVVTESECAGGLVRDGGGDTGVVVLSG